MTTFRNILLSCLLAVIGIAGATITAQAADALGICDSGQPFLWPGGGANIPFNPDQGNLRDAAPLIDNPTGVALVQASFDNWTAAGPYSVPTSATYLNAGPLPVDVDFTNFGPYLNPVAPDGFSAIVFDADGQIFDALFGPGSGVLGFASPEWVNLVTCEILEGYSFLNGPAFDNLIAAEDVMTHEFGHYSNLGHVELNGQLIAFGEGGDNNGPTPADPFPPLNPFNNEIETMYPFYFGSVVETRSPHADDVASIATLYPGATFFADTGSISGAVYAPDGVTRLSGVNVIARNVANPMIDAVSTFSGAYTDGVGQADPNVGLFTLNNLTPGAEYVVFVDEVTAAAGRFSNPILTPLPGPEEYWNTDEANENPPDDPQAATLITPAAGVETAGIDIIFNQPSPGDPLPLGDDAFVELFLPFGFEICAQEFDSVFVNSNGNLTFGVGDTDFSESSTEFLAEQPRIAGLWDDLNPNGGGYVTFYPTDNTFTVSYVDVPEFPATGANSFDITLHRASNNIDVEYGGVTSLDGLAGVSCGGAITSGFETSEDLTAAQEAQDLMELDGIGRINMKPQPARFEQFGFGDNDLDSETLRFNPTTEYNDDWAGKNDSPNNARKIKLPFDSIAVNWYTEIEPTGGDVDFFSFRLKEGHTFMAEIISGQLDTMLVLADENLNIIDFDDDGGAGLLSRLQVVIPANGRYYLGVSTFPDFGFTGAGGSGGRYVLTADSTDATLLDLGDDDTEEVQLFFDFPFNGGVYSSVFVNSNGSLTFGSGDTDFTESVSELLNDQPRIAPLWDDLSPNNGGMVSVEYDSGEATVVFDAVPEFFSTGANTFMVTLRDDGSFTIEYGDITAGDGIAGTTEGGGAADPGPTDLSAGGPFSASGTTYEQFNGNPMDLSGLTLDFNP